MDEYWDPYLFPSPSFDMSTLDQLDRLGDIENDGMELPLGVNGFRPDVECLVSGNRTSAEIPNGSDHQGGDTDHDTGNEPAHFNKFSASMYTKELQFEFSPSFTSGPLVADQAAEPLALNQTVLLNTNNICNEIAKPRVRARRGQATDPHSIAERLRREKISERMKSLQKLVPNSTKADKASMLDEIIEYVKFLQLQVKVLSTSRHEAAGAVVPQITNNQSEGTEGRSLLPSGVRGIDFSQSADQIALEKEVVDLMETNLAAALQYLQSKGLCLMPAALATTISNVKASEIGETYDERDRTDFGNGKVHNDSSSSSNSGLV